MTVKVIKSTWFGTTPEGRAIGVVLCKDTVTGEMKGYIGVGYDLYLSTHDETGVTVTAEEADAKYIAEWGQEAPRAMLDALFGNLDNYHNMGEGYD